MRLVKKLLLDNSYTQKIQNMLDSNTGFSEVPSFGTYDVLTIGFDNGIEVDIKLCGADDQTLFINPVLFDNGSEVAVLDTECNLLGKYVFNYNNNEYVVVVENILDHELTFECIND